MKEEKKERKNAREKHCGDYVYCAWCDWLGCDTPGYCEKAKEKMRRNGYTNITQR